MGVGDEVLWGEVFQISVSIPGLRRWSEPSRRVRRCIGRVLGERSLAATGHPSGKSGISDAPCGGGLPFYPRVATRSLATRCRLAVLPGDVRRPVLNGA